MNKKGECMKGIKKQKKDKKQKPEKIRVMKVGVHRKSVIFLWVLLICSVVFGVYKNFTAIDRHTVHERKVEKEKLVDTNAIENFVKNFAMVYYTWNAGDSGLDDRSEKVSRYLTEELKTLNVDVLQAKVSTSSSVKDIEIWEVAPSKKDNEYQVTFSVDQEIKEGSKKKEVSSVYRVVVHMDTAGNLVIVQNPTISNIPKKSNYQPEREEMDGSVDSDTSKEVTDFLKTFFKLYPSAQAKELSYYVKGDVLKPVGKESYSFMELLNPVMQKDGEKIKVSVSVKYLDQETKAVQISQFDLKLQKDGNWMIVR